MPITDQMSGKQSSNALMPGEKSTTAALMPGEKPTTAARMPDEQSITALMSGEQSTTVQMLGQQSTTSQKPGEQSTTAQMPGGQSTTALMPGEQSTTPLMPGEQSTAAQMQAEQLTAALMTGEQSTISLTIGILPTNVEIADEQSTTSLMPGEQSTTALMSDYQQPTVLMPGEQSTIPQLPGKNSTSALNQFYMTLHSYIADFGMPVEEVKDIQHAVDELVRKLSDEFGSMYPHFKAKSIHGVGSYYEQTKILGPDEFDFLYVLDELSNENAVELKRINTADIIGVEVKVKNEWLLNTGKWLTDTGSDGSRYISNLQFLSDKNVLFIREPVDNFCTVFINSTINFKGMRSLQKSGALSLCGQESTYGPNVEMWFQWKSNRGETLTIKSDITPVIRAFNIRGMVTVTDCSEHYLVKLYSHGSYFVMPSKMRHMARTKSFSPTFTECERDLMLELNDSHRIAYRCLKMLLLDIYTASNPVHWLTTMFRMPEIFGNVNFQQILKKIDYLKHRSFLSSYCLKTALITHATECQRDMSPELCAVDVIEALLVAAHRQPPNLPSVFMKDDNLFFKYSQRGNEQQLHNLKQVLIMLKSFHSKVISEPTFSLQKWTSDVAFNKVFSALCDAADENVGMSDYQSGLSNLSIGKMSLSAAFKYSTKKETLTMPGIEQLMLSYYVSKKKWGDEVNNEELTNVAQWNTSITEESANREETESVSPTTEVQTTIVIYSRT